MLYLHINQNTNPVYIRIFLLLILFLTISCSSDNGSSNDDGHQESDKKYLTSFTNVNENVTDTLVYSDNKLVLRKQYVEGFLDYNHHYIYNSENQLLEINRIHSTSTYPSEKTIYTYYTNGNLKTRHYVGYNRDYLQTFIYQDNVILANDAENNTIRLTLNSEGLISSADKSYENADEFENFMNLEYDSNANVTKVSERFIGEPEYRIFKYTYDTKVNPLFVFDFSLPNGLSIKQLETFFSRPSFGGYSPGSNDNNIVYFNKNNFITFESENGIRDYQFEYNDENYPIKVTLPYYGNDYLNLTYHQ